MGIYAVHGILIFYYNVWVISNTKNRISEQHSNFSQW